MLKEHFVSSLAGLKAFIHNRVNPGPTDVKHDKVPHPSSPSKVVQKPKVQPSPAVKEMMSKVKKKVAKTTRKMEGSAWLFFVEVIINGLFASPVLSSGALPFGILTQSFVIVATILSFLSISILSDLQE